MDFLNELVASLNTIIIQTKTIKIEVYNKKEKTTTTMHVEQLSDNIFRNIENEFFNCSLILGTEFETRLNPER